MVRIYLQVLHHSSTSAHVWDTVDRMRAYLGIQRRERYQQGSLHEDRSLYSFNDICSFSNNILVSQNVNPAYHLSRTVS